MRLGFDKLDGCGNDFIFMDALDDPIELDSAQVAHLCDRHFGIGADGVILVEPPREEGSTAFMNYINSDGTFAQMCGNGVRCFTKYLVDKGIVDPDSNEVVVDTRAGRRAISFERDAHGLMTRATVDMGDPILEPASVPVALESNSCTDSGVAYVKEAELDSPWGPFRFTCVSMGNPHAVCFLDDFDALPDELFSDPADKSLSTFDVDGVGAYFEPHGAFPEKANIEFAHVGAAGIDMRVYERGCGETLACGTGACATNVAAALTGRAGRHNTVHLLGGDLDIDWRESGTVMMTGPAERTFGGFVEVGC